jgi:hypothetical protein
VVEQHDLLRDAQRVVPRQDEGAGAELHAARLRREVREELGIVGTGRVIGEVVLDGEHLVEAERLGHERELGLARDVLGVGHRAAVVLEDELQCDVHALRGSTPAARTTTVACCATSATT